MSEKSKPITQEMRQAAQDSMQLHKIINASVNSYVEYVRHRGKEDTVSTREAELLFSTILNALSNALGQWHGKSVLMMEQDEATSNHTLIDLLGVAKSASDLTVSLNKEEEARKASEDDEDVPKPQSLH